MRRNAEALADEDTGEPCESAPLSRLAPPPSHLPRPFRRQRPSDWAAEAPCVRFIPTELGLPVMTAASTMTVFPSFAPQLGCDHDREAAARIRAHAPSSDGGVEPEDTGDPSLGDATCAATPSRDPLSESPPISVPESCASFVDQALAQRAGQIATAADPPLSQFSAGSMGHPHTCADACRYLRRKLGCRLGAGCPHCHLCHWSRQPDVAARTRQTPTPDVSVGTLGHPEACGPPCKFARRKAGCRDGPRCTKCHVCTWARYAKVSDASILDLGDGVAAHSPRSRPGDPIVARATAVAAVVAASSPTILPSAGAFREPLGRGLSGGEEVDRAPPSILQVGVPAALALPARPPSPEWDTAAFPEIGEVSSRGAV